MNFIVRNFNGIIAGYTSYRMMLNDLKNLDKNYFPIEITEWYEGKKLNTMILTYQKIKKIK